MIVPMLLAICFKGSPEACESSTIAYYKQSGAESLLSEKGKDLSKKNPELAALIGATGMLVHGQYTIQLGKDYFGTFNQKQNIIGIKTTF